MEGKQGLNKKNGVCGGPRMLLAVCAITLLISGTEPAAVGAAQSGRPTQFADPAFQRIWERSDLPVANGRTDRSWAWGNAIDAPSQERYREAPNDLRTVQYFDKARMEVNDPSGNPNDPYYVTNGRLVVEMVSGELQLGLNDLMYVGMAHTCVAGDCPSIAYDLGTPTYADLRRVSSLIRNEEASECRTARYRLCRSPQIPTGAPMPTLFLLPLAYVFDADLDMEKLDEGYIPEGESPVDVKAAAHIKETQHNIPDVFWQFLNSEGTVYERGAYQHGKVVDWVSAFGYPITEPYWIVIYVEGKRRLVLFQAFERRTLTYSPRNPENWRVEMGNVGAQYLRWRKNASPVCSGRGVGHFAGLIDFWYAHGEVRRDLGCPSDAFPFDRVDANLHNIDLKVVTAYQPFERGSMLYLERMVYRGPTKQLEKAIYALFADGSFMQFADTWTEGESISSGAQPPPERLEPVRGFGKAWREGAGGSLRERLGWATGAEQGGEGRMIWFRFGEILWSPVPNKVIVFYGPEDKGEFPATDRDPGGWALKYKVFDDAYKDRR
ncbi:MAG TPA: hypothetical protein VFR15_10045 [Chloroflexia bacterium]|nr:hypothetical protein [Chloroflexia bacterium]